MKLKHIILSIILALSFTACGGDSNSETPASTTVTPDVIAPDSNVIEVNGTVSVSFGRTSSKVLTLNSEVFTIDVLVFGPDNTPYSEGNISVAYPDKAKAGVDVGSFNEYVVKVEKGRASFSYTGPKDLKSLVDSGDASTVFGFYHSSSSATVKDFTFSYEPLPNQKILNTYFLKSSLDDSNITIGLESSKPISFYVEDDKANKVDDSKMISMKVDVLNKAIIELEDMFGVSGDSLTFTGDNDVSLNFKTGTLSGLAPMKVTAIFTDANDVNITIEEIFNVVVFSGPPTAISINYATTSQDKDYAKFQEHLVVAVTDKYFNPVNTRPAISTGAIIGYAKDGVTGKNIYHTPNSATTGTLNPTTKILSANNNMDFSNVDESNDVLATFGIGYTYDAAGKWDFTRSGAANVNELAIIDDYESNETRSNLGFTIGHNYREMVCEPWREQVGTIKVADGSYKLDSLGMAKLTLDYDYYLMGKDIVVWVNLTGFTAKTGKEGKIGEATEHTLRGMGLEAGTVSVSARATEKLVPIAIWMTGTGETYKNANFDYTPVLSDNLIEHNRSSTNGDISSCATGGTAYAYIYVSEEKNETGTVSLTNITIVDEFEN